MAENLLSDSDVWGSPAQSVPPGLLSDDDVWGTPKPKEQRGAVAEIGRQIVGGLVTRAPAMIGGALEWWAPQGSDLEEAGRVAKEYWTEKEKAWEPDLEGRGFVSSTLIKGASQLGPSLAGMGAAMINPVLGGAAVATIFGGQQAQDTYDKGLKAGLSETEASEAAYKTGLIEGFGETVADVAGAKLLTGGGKLLSGLIGKGGMSGTIKAATDPRMAAQFARDWAANAVIQSGTEFGQGYGQAVVERDAGISTGDPLEQGAEGAQSALGMSVLLGPLAAIGGRSAAKQRAMIGDALNDPNAPLPIRMAAGEYVAKDIEPTVGKEAAQSWLQSFHEAAVQDRDAQQPPAAAAPDVATQPKPTGLLGYQPGPPLVVFPDGSTMTGAEAEQRRLDSMVQRATPSDILAAPDVDTAIAAAVDSVAAAQDEFSDLLKTEQFDLAYLRRDAAAESTKAADFARAKDQQTDIQIDQANALTRAQGFDDQTPTAMQLALQRAQQKNAAAPVQTPAPDTPITALPEPAAAAPNVDSYLKQNAAGKWQLSRPVELAVKDAVIAEMDRRNQEGSTNAATPAEAQQSRAALPNLPQAAPEAGALQGELTPTTQPTPAKQQEESVQERGEREFAENYDRVQQDIPGSSTKDLYRAVIFADKAIQSLNLKAQRGEPYNVALRDSLVGERDYLRGEWEKRADRFEQPAAKVGAGETPTAAQQIDKAITRTKAGKLEISGFSRADVTESLKTAKIKATVAVGQDGRVLVSAVGRTGNFMPMPIKQSKAIETALMGKTARAPKPRKFTGNLRNDVNLIAPGLYAEVARGGDGEAMDLDMSLVAEQLKAEGFMLPTTETGKDSDAVIELIRQDIANGGGTLNEARQTKAMTEAELKAHRADVLRLADEYGIQVKRGAIPRALTDIEAELKTAIEQEIGVAGKAMATAYDAALAAGIPADEADAILDRIDDFYQSETSPDRYVMQYREQANALQEAIDAHQEREGRDQEGEGAGNDLPPGAGSEGRPGFELAGQTEAELRAEQERVDAAEAQRLKDEQAAENKRQADAERGAFNLTGSDRPADTLSAQGQGGLFDAPAAESKPDRGEVGASLTKEQRKAVMQTLTDVYKTKGAPKESKGLDQNGNERIGYAYSPELFEKSDITGAPIRYVVTLPDGRIAHPTELFPDMTLSKVEALILEQAAKERDKAEQDKFRREQLERRKSDTLNEANGKFNRANPGLGLEFVPALLTDGKQFIRTHPDSVANDLRLLGGDWAEKPLGVAVESKTLAEASLGDLLRAAADKADGKVASEGKPVATKEPSADVPFDSEAFDKARDERVKESKVAGNRHLDQVSPSVETMRGKEIYYAHNPQQRGVIRTVDNNGNVYVYWADKYSADKELASEIVEDNKSWLKTSKNLPYLREVRDGKTYVFESSLGTTDLKDYVFADGARPIEVTQGKETPASLPSEAAKERGVDAGVDTATGKDSLQVATSPAEIIKEIAKTRPFDKFEDVRDAALAAVRERTGKLASEYDEMRGSMMNDPINEAIHDGQHEGKRAYAATLPVRISESGISTEEARTAFMGTSHSPEKRGASARRGLFLDLVNLWRQFEPTYNAAPEDRQAAFREAFEDAAARYTALTRAYLSAHGRVMSSMITGPARFPVESNRKKSDTADKRAQEASEYLGKARTRLLKVLRGRIDNSLAAQLAEAETKLAAREAAQARMKAVNSAHAKFQKDAASLDKSDLSDADKELIRAHKPRYSWEPHPFAPYELSNNNAEIRRMKDRVEELKRRAEASEAEPKDGAPVAEGVRVVRNAEAGRLQLFFDEKPSEEIRNDLKANGFKWAPSQSAWQRQLTANAEAAATQVIARHFPPKETDKGVALESRAAATITNETPATIRAGLSRALGKATVDRLEQSGLLRILDTADSLPDGLTISSTGTALYDGKTAYIIADRTKPAEAIRAALHEIGEHHGLEGMLGEMGYKTLTNRVRIMEKAGNARVKEAFAFVRSAYPELREDSPVFMKEVLANIGQDADVRAKPWWKEMISAVRRFLVKLGYGGLIRTSDIEDMVLHSLKTAARGDQFAGAGNMIEAMASKVGADGTAFKAVDTESAEGGATNPSILESRQGALPDTGAAPPAPPTRQIPIALQGGAPGNRASWNGYEPSKLDDVIRTLQDKQIDSKRTVQAIKDAGRQVADKWDVYLQETLFHGRAAKRTLEFVETELNPLATDLAMRGLKMAQLEEFLHARHAEEANALIADRNPDMPDGGSGMTNQQAQDYFAKLDPAMRRKLEAVAKRVDTIIANTRKLYVSYGLESQETVDGWADTFNHYVPLMREDKDGGMGIGQGFSIKGKETKSRTGSTRTVVDILANIAMQRERAIVRGEKNRVATALMGLAKLNPNPDFWTFDRVPHEQVFNPKTGLVEDRPDPMFKTRDNVIVAKIADGKGGVQERAVVFAEDNEQAMHMARALKNLDAAQLEGLIGATAKLTRYFASVNTQYNPIFGVTNLVRDVQDAMLNLTSTPIAGHKADVLKHTLGALRGIYIDTRQMRKGQPATSAYAQLWEEFQHEGGQTGYRDMFRTSADRAHAIEKMIDPHGWTDSPLGKVFTAGGLLKVPLTKAQDIAGPLFDWLSDYNEAMENAVRLAAYKVGKEQGMSNQQAAAMAKGLTVNFNRKGQIGIQAGAIYAFFNASMQGTGRIAETLFTIHGNDAKTIRLSKVGQKIVAGGILLGSMQALMLAAMGFGDDEPPEFVRERNTIIPIGDKKYITIPMPLGFAILPNIGRVSTEFVLGGFKGPAKHVARLMGIMADAFNPVGGNGTILQIISPTALDPAVALAENKDWTKKPIAKVSFDKTTPGHKLWKDTASTPSKWIAEAINTMSGGTKHVAGAVSPTPDQIDYLFGQVTGGVGREAVKIEQTVMSTATGEDLPPHKIPLVGRFYGDAEAQSSQASTFYSNINRINEYEAEIKGRRKEGRGSEVSAFIAENPEARLVLRANHAERLVQKLRKEKHDLIEKGATRGRVKIIETRIKTEMEKFNRAVEASKQRQKEAA